MNLFPLETSMARQFSSFNVYDIVLKNLTCEVKKP